MVNQASPLISVCIPTYKGAAHLGVAIESVLAQSRTGIELIIVDDNSPDETPAVVRRYDDERIRYFRNDANLGPEGNWNRCLELARGTYLKLLPQDDVLDVDCLNQQAAVLEADVERSIALVFCARRIVKADGQEVARRGLPRSRRGPVQAHSLVRKCIRYGTNLIGEPGAVLFRRDTANEVGFFDGSIPYVIDLDYWVRLLRHGDAYYIDTPLAAFRVSTGSWSVAIGGKQSEEYRAFITKTRDSNGRICSDFDEFVGAGMARLNNYLRLVFYRLALNR